jgi:hypothetical protein
VRRKNLLLGAGLLVLALCAGLASWLRPADPVRKDFERIQAGMTLTQVEAILGPQGNYGVRAGPGNDRIQTIVAWGDYPDSKGNAFCYWRYDSFQIAVVLGFDGRVLHAEYDRLTRDDDGPLDYFIQRLRQWLSL